MVAIRRLETVAADRLKSRFVFNLVHSAAGQGSPRLFRDPDAPHVCARLATKLCAEGYVVTEPRPGKACDAGFEVKFPDFSVIVIILASHRDSSTECLLLTFCRKSLLRRVPIQSAYDRWASLCTAIEQGLRDDANVTCLLSLTRIEDEARLRNL